MNSGVSQASEKEVYTIEYNHAGNLSKIKARLKPLKDQYKTGIWKQKTPTLALK